MGRQKEAKTVGVQPATGTTGMSKKAPMTTSEATTSKATPSQRRASRKPRGRSSRTDGACGCADRGIASPDMNSTFFCTSRQQPTLPALSGHYQENNGKEEGGRSVGTRGQGRRRAVRQTLHRTCEKCTGANRVAWASDGRRVSVTSTFTASSSRAAMSACTW